MQKDKEKLLSHFIDEEYFLEHWIIVAELTDGAANIGNKMVKRLKWVQSQIKILESAKG